MAGNSNSGGYRPTAPQNNTGVSATGGAGSKNGQPNRYISGGKYGEGQALMQQQQGASMSAGPTPAPAPTPAALPMENQFMQPTNNPMEPITAGVDFGPGPGSDALPSNLDANTRPGETTLIIQKYLPTLLSVASLPDTPDSYKRFINYLMSKQ
jgi:hypothetical protein